MHRFVDQILAPRLRVAYPVAASFQPSTKRVIACWAANQHAPRAPLLLVIVTKHLADLDLAHRVWIFNITHNPHVILKFGDEPLY